jgi:glycosyltransferase involved in cell wall biosynthesis
MRPRLTILSLSTIHQDGRVLREIEYAAREYDVTVVGWGHLDKDRPNVTMRPVQRVVLPPAKRAIQVVRLLSGRIPPRPFEQWYWAKPDHHQALQAVIDSKPDLIHANEAIALPIAIETNKRTGAKVLFDAHEYASEQRSDSLGWRILAQPLYTYIIAHFAPQADAMITVEAHIARKYEEAFGIEEVDVIRNAPPYQNLPFHPVNPGRIRLIHHGGAMKERRLESMIRAIALADERFTLDFMLLPGTSGYLDELHHLAATLASERVHFRPPAPPDAISVILNDYDMGVYLLNPANYNQSMALPNKFFEFIMAGLAVAIGPSPAMASIVEQYGLGVVADSFEPEDLARRLNALSADDIDAMKRRSLAAARELNAENEMRKLLDIYVRLLTL